MHVISPLRRRRLPAVLLLCAALTPALAASARADVYTSDGTSYSGEWSDPDTWVNRTTSGPGVPGASDTAKIVGSDALSLTADTTAGSLEVQAGASLNLSGHTLTSGADVSLLGDYFAPSSLSSTMTPGQLHVAGKLKVENTSVTHVAVTIAKVGGSSPALELSGPIDTDPEASSYWSDSTLTQTGGTAALDGHTFTGDLDPVLSGVALTVRGFNDLNSRQLALDGTGTVTFKPSAVTPMMGDPLLATGTVVVSGTQTASVGWDEFPGTPDDGDDVDLVTVTGGNTNGLTAADESHTAFTRTMTGAKLTASYVGIVKPKPTVDPSLSAASTLTGHALSGQTLTCAPGTWSPDGTKTYTWASGGSPISGATASTYVAAPADAGADVTCEVTVTSVAGGVGKKASGNAVHVDAVPSNITEPEATSAGSNPAKAGVGDVLTCDPGLWTGDAPTYAYTWLRDAGVISGQAADTYTTVAADNGHAVFCRVVATDGLATSSPVASLSGVAVLAPPIATVLPTAKSTRAAANRATTGDVLTCLPGTWVPDGTKAYAWKRGGSPISGATASTYTVDAADLGSDVTCAVTVTANALSATESSASVFIAAAPVNSAAPTVSGADGDGHARIGATLTCAPGTWSASPSFTYAWTRDGSVAAGKTTSTYVVGGDDHSVALRCRVTATADGIDVTASSAPVSGMPADPIVTITAAPSGVIATRSTVVSYTVEDGVTVTGCTLNDTPLPSCASPIALDGLAKVGSYSLVIAVANGTGQTGSGTVSFSTKVAPAAPVIAWPASVSSGTIVYPTFTVEEDATVGCTLDDIAIDCTRTGATVPVPASGWGQEHRFAVTATGPGGSTTAVARFTSETSTLPLVPEVISAPVGTKVTAATGDFLDVGPVFFKMDWYSFRGPLTDIKSTGDFDRRETWGVSFTTPAKPGTYVEEVWLWSKRKFATMTVHAFAVDAVDVEHQLGGVGSRTAPLSCPKGSAGSTYSWYVNDALKYSGDSNLLPAQSVPKNGTVYCVVHDPKGGSPSPIKVLVDNGARLAASTSKDGSSVGITTSDKSSVEVKVESLAGGGAKAAAAAKKKRYKAVTTFTQKLKKGKNTVKLKKKLPKAGFRVTIRIKRAKGGYSKPLVLNKG